MLKLTEKKNDSNRRIMRRREGTISLMTREEEPNQYGEEKGKVGWVPIRMNCGTERGPK
jgi:hypothetical protein